MKITVKLRKKENNIMSNPISIEDIIFNQNELQFVFPDDEVDETVLPYKDFLFYQDEYEVIVGIKND